MVFHYSEDYVALVGFDIFEIPDPWWPLLEVQIPFQVNVTNLGETLVDEGSGIFTVRLHFSTDDIYDESDIGLESHHEDSVFIHTQNFQNGEMLQTPTLTGINLGGQREYVL